MTAFLEATVLVLAFLLVVALAAHFIGASRDHALDAFKALYAVR
jgi:hypothetical protein